MKYLLIFWLGQGSPIVAPVTTDVACNQGIQVLEAMYKPVYADARGVCLPTGGDEHSYAVYLHKANPDMPAD